MNALPQFDYEDEVVILDHKNSLLEEGVWLVNEFFVINGDYYYSLFDYPNTVFSENALALYNEELDSYLDYMDDLMMWHDVTYDEEQNPLTESSNDIPDEIYTEDLYKNGKPKKGKIRTIKVYKKPLIPRKVKVKEKTMDDLLDIYNTMRMLEKTTGDEEYGYFANELLYCMRIGKTDIDTDKYLRFTTKEELDK